MNERVPVRVYVYVYVFAHLSVNEYCVRANTYGCRTAGLNNRLEETVAHAAYA